MSKRLRPLALCVLVGDAQSDANKKVLGEGPFVFLGEIPNMRGHCVVMDRKTGKLHAGYHPENFREMTEDEV